MSAPKHEAQGCRSGSGVAPVAHDSEECGNCLPHEGWQPSGQTALAPVYRRADVAALTADPTRSAVELEEIALRYLVMMS